MEIKNSKHSSETNFTSSTQHIHGTHFQHTTNSLEVSQNNVHEVHVRFSSGNSFQSSEPSMKSWWPFKINGGKRLWQCSAFIMAMTASNSNNRDPFVSKYNTNITLLAEADIRCINYIPNVYWNLLLYSENMCLRLTELHVVNKNTLTMHTNLAAVCITWATHK